MLHLQLENSENQENTLATARLLKTVPVFLQLSQEGTRMCRLRAQEAQSSQALYHSKSRG